MATKLVGVEVRITSDGVRTPLRVELNGRWLKIAQISRTWSDEKGDHWLTMTAAPQQVVRLTLTPDGTWQARVTGSGHARA